MDVVEPSRGIGRRLLGALADIGLPDGCLMCRAAPKRVPDDLCGDCQRLLLAAQADYCTRCGRSAAPYTTTAGGCPRCRGRRIVTAGRVRCGEYRDALAEAILAFKYRGRWELDRCLASRLADVARGAPWMPQVEAVVAVPTCWQHRLHRRLHATTLIAPAVAKACGRPLVPLLRRIKGGPHQVGVSEEVRVRNVRGKFRIAPGVTIRGATLCLIDDVLTTGATMNECAKVLRRAGAKAVYGALLASAGRLPGRDNGDTSAPGGL